MGPQHLVRFGPCVTAPILMLAMFELKGIEPPWIVSVVLLLVSALAFAVVGTIASSSMGGAVLASSSPGLPSEAKRLRKILALINVALLLAVSFVGVGFLLTLITGREFLDVLAVSFWLQNPLVVLFCWAVIGPAEIAIVGGLASVDLRRMAAPHRPEEEIRAEFDGRARKLLGILCKTKSGEPTAAWEVWRELSASGERRTLQQLVDATGHGKGAISNALGTLQRAGAVEITDAPQGSGASRAFRWCWEGIRP